MMKCEFEEALGFSVSQEAYDRIEYVYQNVDFFESKEQLYHFYKLYDMNGIERMYMMARDTDAITEELRATKIEAIEQRAEIARLKRYKIKLDEIHSIVDTTYNE